MGVISTFGPSYWATSNMVRLPHHFAIRLYMPFPSFVFIVRSPSLSMRLILYLARHFPPAPPGYAKPQGCRSVELHAICCLARNRLPGDMQNSCTFYLPL